jgi:hypothetical protein
MVQIRVTLLGKPIKKGQLQGERFDVLTRREHDLVVFVRKDLIGVRLAVLSISLPPRKGITKLAVVKQVEFPVQILEGDRVAGQELGFTCCGAIAFPLLT